MSITGVGHVNLAITDLEAARRFYATTLGLAELHRPDVGGRGAWFDVGGTQLHLSVVDAMPMRSSPGLPHLALHVPTAEFGSWIAELRSRGVVFMGDVRTRLTEGTEWSNVFCADPDGNAIELTDLGA
jgi:glyoxylase I family protein